MHAFESIKRELKTSLFSISIKIIPSSYHHDLVQSHSLTFPFIQSFMQYCFFITHCIIITIILCLLSSHDRHQHQICRWRKLCRTLLFSGTSCFLVFSFFPFFSADLLFLLLPSSLKHCYNNNNNSNNALVNQPKMICIIASLLQLAVKCKYASRTASSQSKLVWNLHTKGNCY